MRLGCLERLDWVTMEALWKVSKQPGSVGTCWVAREGIDAESGFTQNSRCPAKCGRVEEILEW